MTFRRGSDPRFSPPTTMSKLNPGAFSFVPGRGFVPNTPSQPPPPPVERPEQTEAPRPPPTISLNIGGSSTPPSQPAAVPKPPPPAAEKPVAEAPKPVAPKIVKPDAAAPSKTFSTEKAKTDTSAIAAEVKALADQSTLEDLYGNSAYRYYRASINLNFIPQPRSILTSSSSAMLTLEKVPWAAICFI